MKSVKILYENDMDIKVHRKDLGRIMRCKQYIKLDELLEEIIELNKIRKEEENIVAENS